MARVRRARVAGSYGAEVGTGAAFAGVDQGIDFTGRAPVFALGDGVITRLERSNSGWPGQGALLVYQLKSGPRKDSYVYVAEDFDPAPGLQVGSEFTQGATLGVATGSNEAPGIETGWADSAGHAFGKPFPRQPTSFGENFDAFVKALSEGDTPSAGTGSSGAARPARPADSAASGPTKDGGGGGSGFAGFVTSAFDSTAADLSWLSGITDFSGGLVDVFKMAVWLMQPKSWLRAVEFLTGMVFLLLSLVGLAVMFLQRSGAVGAAAEVATAAPGPLGRVGKAVTTVRRPRQAARQTVRRRANETRARERWEERQAGTRKQRERAEQARLEHVHDLDEERRRRRGEQFERDNAAELEEIPF